MGLLQNYKHETVIQGLASGMTHREAWAAAGYAGFQANYVSKIVNRPECKARLRELQRKAADKTTNTIAVNRAQITSELDEVRKLALAGKVQTDRDGNPVMYMDPETKEMRTLSHPDLANALRASEGKAKLYGLFVDVQAEENLDDALKDKNIDELRQQLAGEIHDLDPNLHKQGSRGSRDDDDSIVDDDDAESVPAGHSLQ